MNEIRKPKVVGIGGTTKSSSSTEQALRMALAAAADAGAETVALGGEFLSRLPHYGTPVAFESEDVQMLVESVRSADGLIFASPGYHGSISGLVKNAIDYVEETSKDARTYLDGLPVGLIATAYGWQAAVNTLGTLRTIVHSLRGWPTPLGASLNSSTPLFKDGECLEPAAAAQLSMVGRQVYDFAVLRMRDPIAAKDAVRDRPNTLLADASRI